METLFNTQREIKMKLSNAYWIRTGRAGDKNDNKIAKKEVEKKFRKWAGNILDDIIFNESAELKKQLKEKEEQLQLKEKTR